MMKQRGLHLEEQGKNREGQKDADDMWKQAAFLAGR